MHGLSSMRIWVPGANEDPAAAEVIRIALSALDSQVFAFAAALSLIEHSLAQADAMKVQVRKLRSGPRGLEIAAQEQLHIVREWQQIAQRDAVMTIYHFGVALDSVNFKNLPRLQKTVDHNLLRSARSTFQRSFPDNVQARHSVSHSADRHADAESVDKTMHEGGFEFPDLAWQRVPPSA